MLERELGVAGGHVGQTPLLAALGRAHLHARAAALARGTSPAGRRPRTPSARPAGRGSPPGRRSTRARTPTAHPTGCSRRRSRGRSRGGRTGGRRAGGRAARSQCRRCRRCRGCRRIRGCGGRPPGARTDGAPPSAGCGSGPRPRTRARLAARFISVSSRRSSGRTRPDRNSTTLSITVRYSSRPDVADARGCAAADVVVEAGDAGAAAGLRPLARPVREHPVQHVERLAHLLRARVRAEVEHALAVPLAREHHPRVLVADRDRDVRVRLVVAQADVERRAGGA